MVSVNSYIQWCDSDDYQGLRDYFSEQIIWMEIIHTATDLDFLVLSLKIIHKNDYNSHAITAKP